MASQPKYERPLGQAAPRGLADVRFPRMRVKASTVNAPAPKIKKTKAPKVKLDNIKLPRMGGARRTVSAMRFKTGKTKF